MVMWAATAVDKPHFKRMRADINQSINELLLLRKRNSLDVKSVRNDV